MRKRDQFLGNHKRHKYALIDGKYFIGFGIPKWPSPAFSRFINNHLCKEDREDVPLLDTLIFAVTKSCSFTCEHCFEWNNLNKKETLSQDTLAVIVNRFSHAGISMVQFSGGEPLNRLKDILYVLKNSPRNIEYWMYSNGYAMTGEKARQLKEHGLTGVAISLDHHMEDKHDQFRGVKGSYRKVLDAAKYCEEAGLAVCFSFCATRDTAEEEQLTAFADLAHSSGVQLIQILEARATGHYAGQDVALGNKEINTLENFFLDTNFSESKRHQPSITYHGFYSRRTGCVGGAKSYVYVDTDGYIHSCPFCQQQLYHALDPNLHKLLQEHKKNGCSSFTTTIDIVQPQKLAI
jgi:MoaA/NifB/PqqE/SkfB family radical SAM enzyme